MGQCGSLKGGYKISVSRAVPMHILVCNTGSSSLKFSLFEIEGERLLAEGGIDWSTTPTRLVVRCTEQPEVREELTLRHHADAITRILVIATREDVTIVRETRRLLTRS
jgi:acetate kinase